MNRLYLFVALLAAFALAAPEITEARNHRGGGMGGGMGGKGGFGKKGGMKGGEQGASETASPQDNPLSRYASADVLKKGGLVETGLRPVYPDSAECLEIKSHFSSPTRFDGSFRVSSAFAGYHSGSDISAPIGTPIIAIADGEVIHKYVGGRLVGNQIYLRHTPEDTGLNVTLYSKYKHFNKLPDLEIGQRVKMGQFLGPSGDTGTAGGHFPTGYPHLHMSLYTGTNGEYSSTENSVYPKGAKHLDPVALYMSPPITDSLAALALDDDKKNVPIAFMTTGGKVMPEGARIIWPFACAPK
ncbi:MAG: M23 family metallopeptidase [Alphaproteobacteria bacterium]|jgi:murein DD-endopeptidase MepM/ murein hydrolase activator NlpD|nr:M23 family metallopeptidase [Alphaproteobacteria bacterium]MBT7943110.1 M23 family metallopeptidase [Alphaproteobacteria bacterium]